MEGKDCHRMHLAYAGKRKTYYHDYCLHLFTPALRGIAVSIVLRLRRYLYSKIWSQ